MPKRVAIDAATSAAPASADSTRLRRPSRAPATPAAVKARPVRSSRPARPSRYGSLSKPSRVSTLCDPYSSIAPPATASRRAGPDSASGAAIRAIPEALARALPAKTHGSSGYASCHDGTAVSASRTAVYVPSAGAIPAAAMPAARLTGGSARRANPSAPRRGGQAGSRPEGREDPGPHRHRRGRFGHAQHVVEPLRAPQIVDEKVRAGAQRAKRGQPPGAAQSRPAGEVRGGGHERGAGGEAAGEQVRRNVVPPHRRLDHRPPIVRLEAGHDASGSLAHCRRPRNAAATAAAMASAATPALRHIAGRSRVVTTGSGGRP